MDMNRLNDMLERYGEVCTQKTAGKILNVVPRTISRMMEEGRLRRVGRGVDVRSTLVEGAFLAAARSGKWSAKR